jgi:predicted O-linked N-acetylglucosamine transferase (SPINDLY family)
MNNINTIKNYTQQHIYKIITVRYPYLSPQELLLKLQSTFKELINNIRQLSTTNELDKFNTPMGFLFQHLKRDIIHIIANLSPNNDKIFLERELIYNIDWNIRLFICLKTLNAKDIIVWYFLQIPYFNQNANENIIKFRILYEQLLDYFLINWTEDLYLTEYEFIYISNETCMPYAISYHNQNNNTILSKYCKLLRKICPWLNYYSPKLTEKVLKTRTQYSSTTNQNTNPLNNIAIKIKICFISDCFITDTSVLRDRISIIGKLDRSKYDVYIASFNPIEKVHGIIANIFMNKFKDQYIYLGFDDKNDKNDKHSRMNRLNRTMTHSILNNARTVLDKYEFDYIVYPDLGMKLLPTLLAYSRIALKQLTTWGHSETSGIDTIDYYISSKWFELSSLSEAQKHYTEKLILFNSLGTYYISPHKLFIDNNPKLTNIVDKKFKTKTELGFNLDNNIYCCLQTFYKINAQFEQCMARILELDPNAIILLSNTFPYCKSHLARIKSIVGEEKIKRLRWYPSLEKPIFLNLVQISNVCLDPFPFGGCNTSYDAFDYNIPVITLPSDYLHGRFTIGLYNKMGLSDCECIVSSMEEYARVATNIGINTKLRHKINRNIEMNKHLIYQEQDSVDEWNELFSKISISS